MPIFNRKFIESIWEKSLEKAVNDAEDEMGKKCLLTSLSWSEFFEDKCTLSDGDKEDS